MLVNMIYSTMYVFYNFNGAGLGTVLVMKWFCFRNVQFTTCFWPTIQSDTCQFDAHTLKLKTNVSNEASQQTKSCFIFMVWNYTYFMIMNNEKKNTLMDMKYLISNTSILWYIHKLQFLPLACRAYMSSFSTPFCSRSLCTRRVSC